MSQPAPAGAIFLSYAREDADAARRIADALRAFGMEVWFDQNELRGGDVWDQKIRLQIRECALFMPILSATTQERGEGYFRREWKLGVERTHDMASGVPFVVPVSIDGTSAEDAGAPDEFLKYQWTQLKHGVPSAEFVEQVRRLLEAPRKLARAKEAARAATPPPGSRGKWIVIAVVVLLAAGAAAYFVSRRAGAAATEAATTPVGAIPAPAASDKSVAVLPFENMSSGKDSDAFFADGIHEDILTKLSLVKALRVVSRTSVMQYRGTTKSVPQIARELGVAYILEGSVRRAGDKVRVTGQLIRAVPEEHIWAQAYDRDVTDIFGIQAELAQSIADALQAQLSPEEKSLVANRPTENAEAYDLYLRARKARNGGEPFTHYEPLLRSAVQLDPKFAVAWGELATVDAFAAFNCEDSTPERLDAAKRAIDEAVRLSPDDPAVIEAVGDYEYYAHRNYEGAREQYLRLAELRPNDPSVHRALGLIHRRKGEWRDAVRELRLAVDRDPANISAGQALVETLFMTRQYAELERIGPGIEARFPSSCYIGAIVGSAAFSQRGDESAVRALWARTYPGAAKDDRINSILIGAELIGDLPVVLRIYREHPYLEIAGDTASSEKAGYAVALAEAGQTTEARAKAEEALAALEAEAGKQAQNPYFFTCRSAAYSLLGRHDEAIRDAERAMQLVPVAVDHLQGPAYVMAHVAALAWAGKTDAALAEFDGIRRGAFFPPVTALRRGYAAPSSLKPLRDNPRFKAMLDDPASNAPLF